MNEPTIESRPTLLLVGHGASDDEQVGAPVRQLAERLRDLDDFAEVAVAFVREEPRVEGAIERCAGDQVVVVPVLTSQGYFADRVIPERLGLSDGEGVARSAGREVVYTEAIGTHPAMVEVVEARIREVLGGVPEEPGGFTIVVAGHGTTEHPDSSGSTERVAAELADRGGWGEVRAGFLDEPPGIADAVGNAEYGQVVVVPFFIAEGPHVAEEIPALLGSDASFDGFPRDFAGHRVWYTRPVGTASEIGDVVVERAREGFRRAVGDSASPDE